MTEQTEAPEASPGKRQRWMAVLAKALPDELSEAWEGLGTKPRYRHLRRPEAGMVMVRGRMGGSGSRFNIGEMTVTRCAVQVEGGAAGYGYVAGRNGRHAELAAVFDALLQDPARQAALSDSVVEPLAARQADRRRQESVKAASTKVEFFTIVRGENAR